MIPRDLDPSIEEARRWLADELARSDYHDTRSILQRLLDWLARRVSELQDTQGTGGVSLPPIVITVVLVVLLLAGAILLTKVRAERRVRQERRSVLGGTTATADTLRAAGAAALGGGRYDEAVLAFTRALARDADRRTLLHDAPTLTAHEVGAALARAFPDHVDAIGRSMDLFDAVAYGDLSVTRADAELVRDTDLALQAARPVLAEITSDVPAPAALAAPTGAEAGSVWLTGTPR